MSMNTVNLNKYLLEFKGLNIVLIIWNAFSKLLSHQGSQQFKKKDGDDFLNKYFCILSSLAYYDTMSLRARSLIKDQHWCCTAPKLKLAHHSVALSGCRVTD